MRPSARVKAAIDVMDDIVKRHRPASDALADWGKSNRYAGSGDRSAIGTLVFDALRKRASSAHATGNDKPRGWVLGALMRAGGATAEQVAALCDGGQHSPDALSDAERAALETESRRFATAQGYAVDWESVSRLDDEALVNGIAQIAPFDAASKQALLEANSLSERAELIVQLLHFFGRHDGEERVTLQ